MAESVFVTSSIRFNTTGLIVRKNESARQLWLNALNDVIEFRAFDLPPDIPVRLNDARGLQSFYETGAKSQQGKVITCEVRNVQNIPAIMLELQLPAQPRGSTFVRSLTLPFAQGSFVIKAQAIEVLEADLDNLPPEHALSRVRQILAQIETSLILDAALAQQSSFGQDKPWWKLW